MSNPNQCFTTGAHIQPFWNKEILRWQWVVVEFEDDTFKDGDFIEPDVVASSVETLLNKFSDNPPTPDSKLVEIFNKVMGNLELDA